MPGHARRSRLVALGLSVGGLAGLVTAMVASERPVVEPVAASPAVSSTTVTAVDAFTAGPPATPPGSPPAGRARRTVTSAS